MHLQPVFASVLSRDGEVAEGFFDRGFCLLSGSALTEADIARVIEAVLQVRRVPR